VAESSDASNLVKNAHQQLVYCTIQITQMS